MASQPASIRNITADQKCHGSRSEITWKNRNPDESLRKSWKYGGKKREKARKGKKKGKGKGEREKEGEPRNNNKSMNAGQDNY